MDHSTFDRLTMAAARKMNRRGAAAALALVAAGAGMAGRTPAARAQQGSIGPGGACLEHRQCALLMDAPATFCLERAARLTCCSIQAGICASDAECCSPGRCMDGLCVAGPQFDTWISVREIDLLAGPDADSESLRHIPAGSKVRIISASPHGGWLTATWEGAYGWVPASSVVFEALGV